MKKLFSVFTAMLLVFAVVGSATAAGVGQVALSAFDPTGNEVILDLGIGAADFGGTDQLVGNIASIGDYTQVGAHMLDGNSFFGWQRYFGTTNPNAPVIVGTLTQSFNSASQNIDLVTPGVVHSSTGENNSFVNNMGANGSYAGFNDTQADGVISLATLAVNPVDIYLYGFDGDSLIPGGATDYLAKLTIYDSGDVVLNPVPVPAAVWLLGSGLLALVGVRRRKS